jgi:hypothetical protein
MSRRPDKPKQDLRSAALLLGLDADKLTEADTLRCQLVSTLRGAIDHEQARTEAGSSADLAKLVTAIEALTKLLPASVTAPPPVKRRSQEDAFKFFGDIIDMIMKSADVHAPLDGTSYEALRQENGLLRLALHMKTGSRDLSLLQEIEANLPEAVKQLNATLGALETENARLRDELATFRGAPRRPTQLALPAPSEQPMPVSNETDSVRNETPPPTSAKPAPNGAASAPNGAPPPQPPQPRPLDLRAQGAEKKGGSAGFEIRGSSRIIDDGGGFYWGGASGRRSW